MTSPYCCHLIMSLIHFFVFLDSSEGESLIPSKKRRESPGAGKKCQDKQDNVEKHRINRRKANDMGKNL